MRNPLLDIEFLKKLDNQTEHEIYAKIISLDFDENPQEEITGRVTSGSVNVDGTSAVRRTCSVSLVAQEVNINDFYWGLNTKFKLYVGMKNFSDPQYEDIIWFKQGTFIIDSFNTSYGISDFSISISGKDKMCLLNGDIGGNLTAISTDFGKYDQIDADGNVLRYDYPIKEIITEAVHHYGKEPYHNIIVDDLDDEGLELMEYRGDVDLFLLIDSESGDVKQLVFDDSNLEKKKFITENGKEVTLKEITYDTMLTRFYGKDKEEVIPTKIRTKDNNNYCTVEKVSYGDACGYRLTELVFAGDLIAELDNTITSGVLDKIVNMLGDYEYFYDIDGRFHFQRKRLYINKSWNSIKSNSGEEDYAESQAYEKPVVYSFNDSNLVTSFSNTPDYANLKNDFAIWGVKKISDSTEVPFHLRYAIDEKPVYYKAFDGTIYATDTYYGDDLNKDAKRWDWRELIYQMAYDFYQHQHDEDFLATLARNNIDYYPTGMTGYEQYYIDMQGFWRQIYNPNLMESIDVKDKKNINRNNNYYVWDDEINGFDNYGFKEATDIIPVEENGEYYYYNGLITINQIKKELQECEDSIKEAIANQEKDSQTNDNEYKLLLDELNNLEEHKKGLEQQNANLPDLYNNLIKDVAANASIQLNVTKQSIKDTYDGEVSKAKTNKDTKIKNLDKECDKKIKDKLLSMDQNYAKELKALQKKYKKNSEKYKSKKKTLQNKYTSKSSRDKAKNKIYATYKNKKEKVEEELQTKLTELTKKYEADIAKVIKDNTENAAQKIKVLREESISAKAEIDSKIEENNKDIEQVSLSIQDILAEKSAITEYYQKIIDDNNKVLNESVDGHLKREFLSLEENDYASMDELIKIFYPLSEKLSEGKWKDYKLYKIYDESEDYYTYKSAKDLSLISSRPQYYTRDSDGNYQKYNTKVEIDDISGRKNIVEDYLDKINVVAFEPEKVYYTYIGLNRRDSVTSGEDKVYYSYGKFKKADIINPDTYYYILDDNKFGDENLFIKQPLGLTPYPTLNDEDENASFENATDVTVYYEKVSNNLSGKGIYGGYEKQFEIKKDIKYYAKTEVTVDSQPQILESEINYFSRGIQYYYKEDGVEKTITVEKGVSYFADEGYSIALDLSSIKPDYYVELNTNDIVPKEEALLIAGRVYYGYFKEDNESLKNGYYYLKDEENSMVKENILRNFQRGKTYYEYRQGYELINDYNYNDELLYYISIDDKYQPLDKEFIETFTKDDESIETLYKKYGIGIYEDGTIYKLGRNYDFYLDKTTYWPINYYELAFYKRKKSYDPEAVYYSRNGYDYTKIGNMTEEEFNRDINAKYYIKLDNDSTKVYLSNEFDPKTGWTRLLDTPENLIFWFDFLDADQGDYAQYSVKAIGDRPKVINEDTVKSIYYRDIPTVIFCGNDGVFIKTFLNRDLFKASKDINVEYYEKNDNGSYEVAQKYTPNKDYYKRIGAADQMPGYTYINLNDTVDNLFSISAQGKTAFDVLNQFLNDHVYCAQSVTMNTIPIYYLEPGNKVSIHDEYSGIDGDYLISRLTIPLDYNGTMSITATKATDRVI